MQAGSLLTVTMNLIISTMNINSWGKNNAYINCVGMSHPGAVEHTHPISIPLNQAMALCLLLREFTYQCVLHIRCHWQKDNFEIFRIFTIIMAIMVKWRGRLQRG